MDEVMEDQEKHLKYKLSLQNIHFSSDNVK